MNDDDHNVVASRKSWMPFLGAVRLLCGTIFPLPGVLLKKP